MTILSLFALFTYATLALIGANLMFKERILESALFFIAAALFDIAGALYKRGGK
jgi:hypothetical protein